ncbi:hypothetical protein HS7_20870 [Sulfolobales archaeon HS-7]|nr:hypothetical protein HS7_20870 [Sulfolobales archaeon HS-7]
MTYINTYDKLCFPAEIYKIREGDRLLLHPATVKIGHSIVTFPPFSFLSNSCDNEVSSPAWIDDVEVRNHSNFKFLGGNEKVRGRLAPTTSAIPTLFTLYHLWDELELNINTHYEGIPILTLGEIPILTVLKGVVHICTLEMRNVFTAVASVVNYYLPDWDKVGVKNNYNIP